MRVEVTEQDEGRGDLGRCDPPCRPITARQGPSLHPMMPQGRCKQTRSLKLHSESRFYIHPRHPLNPSMSARYRPDTPPPRAADWDRGEVGERPCRKPPVFGPGRRSSVTPAGPVAPPGIFLGRKAKPVATSAPPDACVTVGDLWSLRVPTAVVIRSPTRSAPTLPTDRATSRLAIGCDNGTLVASGSGRSDERNHRETDRSG